jgi:hypothetical protein
MHENIKYRQILVKVDIWRRLLRAAASLETERGRSVSRGDVIAEMLDQQFPHISGAPEGQPEQEACHQ